MRVRGKVDRNHAEIVRALRQAGASVQSLGDIGDGCPDLLVGFAGTNYVFEVKDGLLPPSKQRLTPQEKTWHGCWMGQVVIVKSVDDALFELATRRTENCPAWARRG